MSGLASCLYEGTVRHRRRSPVAHAFRYHVFLVYLDLAELGRVFRGRLLWSTTRAALARFRRDDHVGDPAVPLDATIRDLVAGELGRRPEGPIRVLTHLRYAGYVFNPVSFFYCFAADGETLDAVVAEVTSTPWGERHCYVVDARAGGRAAAAKALHVSPFMPMGLEYGFRFATPGERLAVHMTTREGGRPFFGAALALRRRPITTASLARALVRYPLMTLRVMAAIHWQALRRRPITTASLARALVRYPLMTLRVMAAIHWQALRLWWKGAPVHAHPKYRAAEARMESPS